MLRAGFNDSRAVQEILGEDHSLYGEMVLSEEDLHIVDSLVLVAKRQIVLDSSTSYMHRAEGAGGKKVFDFIFEAMESKWLDSLARKRSIPFILPDEKRRRRRNP